MTRSIPIPANADLTQYNHIQATRPTDGAVIRAQRVVVDEMIPIRWTIVVKDRLEKYLLIEDTTGGVRKSYSTSELIELAQRAGFGEWQQSQVAEWEGLALVDGVEKKVLTPQYQEPDRTPYPKN